MKAEKTPMMEQYWGIKSQYLDALLLFRLGDFYELFEEDARVASQILQITLTTRNGVPMCGIPYHALDNYLPKLVESGHKVAVCEQVEEPSRARGVVKREVVRVVMPGTLLDEREDQEYVASLFFKENLAGLAFIDLSTGEFKLSEGEKGKVLELLERVSPKTLLMPEGMKDSIAEVKELTPFVYIETVEDWLHSPDTAREILHEHFGVNTLSGFGCEDRDLGVAAAGALLYYLTRLQGRPLVHIKGLSYYSPYEYLYLDAGAVRHLELLKNMVDGSSRDTLFSVLNRTLTPMGKRVLKEWLLHPLRNGEEIKKRWVAIGELIEAEEPAEEMGQALEGVRDLDRLSSRIALKLATPRELAGLRDSLQRLHSIEKALSLLSSPFFEALKRSWDNLDEISRLLEVALVDLPPTSLKDGGIIREGYLQELDGLRGLGENAEGSLREIEERERRETGIPSLRVKYNRVFGYYLEVTRPHLSKVPGHYIRKQTLAKGERFTTGELDELEVRIVKAREGALALEQDIFLQLREKVAQQVERIQMVSRQVAILDVILSLARVATDRSYSMPRLSDTGELTIRDGRHPGVERALGVEFVPNDTHLSPQQRIQLITGPNMSGKSTYIRQVALLVIMAQMGSFVPAEEMELPLFDRVLTRIGAGDELTRGKSTFMVEMTEVSNILHNATPSSLLILDEVGRGTSTYDGLALAWAMMEYIATHVGAYTLFATHYHELTQLQEVFNVVRNYNVGVREWHDQVIFLHKVEPGAVDRSYGIYVARLAGLPPRVTKRASEILDLLEKGKSQLKKERGTQLSLFAPGYDPLREELRLLNLRRLSPLEAYLLLERWKREYQE